MAVCTAKRVPPLLFFKGLTNRGQILGGGLLLEVPPQEGREQELLTFRRPANQGHSGVGSGTHILSRQLAGSAQKRPFQRLSCLPAGEFPTQTSMWGGRGNQAQTALAQSPVPMKDRAVLRDERLDARRGNSWPPKPCSSSRGPLTHFARGVKVWKGRDNLLGDPRLRSFAQNTQRKNRSRCLSLLQKSTARTTFESRMVVAAGQPKKPSHTESPPKNMLACTSPPAKRSTSWPKMFTPQGMHS